MRYRAFPRIASIHSGDIDDTVVAVRLNRISASPSTSLTPALTIATRSLSAPEKAQATVANFHKPCDPPPPRLRSASLGERLHYSAWGIPPTGKGRSML